MNEIGNMLDEHAVLRLRLLRDGISIAMGGEAA
jgi:hypothetical protein